jgi:hypothetical protein
MELVEGEPLSRVIARSPLEPRRAATLARQVTDAVAHAHAQSVLHRDLKPENVLVQVDGLTRVCDFGLATLAGHERLTESSASLGTAAYSAPEQLDGRARDADARADVYALGGILFAALTGSAPFDGKGVALLKKVLLDRAPLASSRAPAVPRDLDLVCAKALEKDPDRRYATAAALRDDLDRFLRGEPVSAKPPTQRDRLARWTRKNASRIAGGVVLAAAFAALGVGLVHSRRQDRERALVRAVESCEAADATPETIEAVLRDFPAEEEALCERARALLLRALERELVGHERRALEAAGGRALDRAALLELARLARKAPCADLVGEREGPIPLGDALVDAGCLDVAEELAAKTLAATPGDPAARFLRARVRLARAGAPSAPLGPGRLDRDSDGATLEDLRAASGLPGVPGARAAWLLAELLAIQDPLSAPAREALARASQRTWSTPEVRVLKEALELEPTGASYALLAQRVLNDPRLAVRALGRFLARCGMRGALEDPGLAEEAALGHGDPRPVVADARAYRPCLTYYPNAPQAESATLVDELAFYPRNAWRLRLILGEHRVPDHSGAAWIVEVLEASENLESLRDLTTDLQQDKAKAVHPDDATKLFVESTFPAGFEVAASSCVRTLYSAERQAFSDATGGVIAIHAISDLDDVAQLGGVSADVSHGLVFDAHEYLRRLEHLGGATVLPFRARLRRLAFPGKLGSWLARVDLERVLWLATHAEELDATCEKTAARGLGIVQFNWLLFVAAIEAWCPVRGHGVAVDRSLEPDARRLADLGLQWTREQDVYARTVANPKDPSPLDERLNREAESVILWKFLDRATKRAGALLESAPRPLFDEQAFRDQARMADAVARCRRDSYRFVSPVDSSGKK